MLLRGLSSVPRIQDICGRAAPEALGQDDGPSKLVTYISSFLGISDVPAKIERFAKLASLRRTTQSGESRLETPGKCFQEAQAFFAHSARRVASEAGGGPAEGCRQPAPAAERTRRGRSEGARQGPDPRGDAGSRLPE